MNWGDAGKTMGDDGVVSPNSCLNPANVLGLPPDGKPIFNGLPADGNDMTSELPLGNF